MQAALRLSATVQPGGQVEVTDAQLPDGSPVDVIVLIRPAKAEPRHSSREVPAAAPGHLAFQTAGEVDAYVREERDAWER